MPTTRKAAIAAYLMAATLTVAVIGAMIIVHEESGPVKDLLDLLTGHHWLTKSVLSVLLFGGASWLLVLVLRHPGARRVTRAENVWGWTVATVVVTIAFTAGSAAIYLLHYLAPR